jgi:hypothetical protein
VTRDVQEQKAGVSGPAMVKPIERAEQARRTIEGADTLREKQVGDAGRE